MYKASQHAPCLEGCLPGRPRSGATGNRIWPDRPAVRVCDGVRGPTPDLDMVEMERDMRYSTTLRSLTEGRGIHTEEFSHYEEMPGDMQKKVIDQAQKEEE